jgi:hypothetical protein
MRKQLKWGYVSVLVTLVLVAAAPSALVTDGLIVHLDAGTITGLSDGASVTSWADSATSDTINGTVSQSSGFGAPVYKTNRLAGRPVVRFTKTNRDVLASAAWNWTSANGVTVLAVFTGGSDPANGVAQRLWQVGSTSGTAGQYLPADVTAFETTQTAGVRYGNGNAMISSANNPLSAGVFNISAWQIADGGRYDSVKWYMNGELLTFDTYTNGATLINLVDNSNEVTIGNGRQTAGWVAADYYNGDVAEVLVYNTLLTQTQIGQVTQYLRDKYYNTTAWNPSPSYGATSVGTISGSKVSVTFGWNTGMDPNNFTVSNPSITKHYFYLNKGEPNFAGVTPVEVSSGSATASYGPILLDMDATYYWRVNESINGSLPSSPSTLTGPVWFFSTQNSTPVILSPPTNVLAEPGAPASFSLVANSISPESYEWFKTPDNANDTPDGDTAVGTNSNSLSLDTTTTANEGYYYCKVSNSGGSVKSNVVQFGIKRLVAHWTLDASDFVGGLYLDSSGEGHHAEPNVLPTTGSFAAGVDPAETAEALDTTVVPLSVADSGDWAAAAYTSQITVSAWLKWAGPNGAWQGIVSNRVVPTNGNFYIEIRQDNGNVQIGTPGGTDLIARNLPVGEWTHVAVTASSSGRMIYFDGLPVVTRSPANAITQLEVPMYLGALGRNDTTSQLSSPFNGVMDEVQIFNYAKSGIEVADLYYDIVEKPVCINIGSVDLQFDVAGGGTNGDEPDCRVNLADFSVIAQTWLNCGLYPVCP